MTSVGRLNLKFHISPDVIFQPVQLGESLLLHTKSLQYFAFDRLGTRVWQAMQDCNEADRIVDAVAADSGLDEAVLVERIRVLLERLARSGLIILVE